MPDEFDFKNEPEAPETVVPELSMADEAEEHASVQDHPVMPKQVPYVVHTGKKTK